MEVPMRKLVFLAALLAALAQAGETPAAGPREIALDLGAAVKVALPTPGGDLKPAPFTTPDGRTGWAVRIPGHLPIATPAYADGLLFVGGGYGSHEFYAFHADTGEVAWKLQTADDGPTAAVVEDGCVAFNTESCTVVVAEARTGKVLWQKWLGDPLMSQPAVAAGRIFLAYPAGDGHRLWCADLKTGKELWQAPLTGEVISAPVIAGDTVYLTCFDGTAFALKAADGAVLWKRRAAGTSAPLLAGRELVLTAQAARADGGADEGLQRVNPSSGEARDGELLARGEAKYLREGGGGGVALPKEAAEALDAAVGFGEAPASAGLDATAQQLGLGTVIGGWAYQGSRATVADDRLMMAQGLAINCVSFATGAGRWRAMARGPGVAEGMQLFSPPAVGRAKLYLCSAQGHLLALGQEDGKVAFLYATGHPIVFQPALAGGNVYAGTADGLLLCLKTGDPDADGWHAWGGNAQHNKSYAAPEEKR